MRVFILLCVLSAGACKAPQPVTIPQPTDSEVILSHALNSTVALVQGNDIFCSGSFVQGDTVITAEHCVDDAETVELMTYQGKKYTYRVAKKDAVHDAALLIPTEWVNAHPVLNVASTAPTYGAQVVLVGHPYGMGWSVFTGRVNNPSQYGFGNHSGEDHWVMSDNGGGPGTSGGPLLNEFGELVGINIWHPVRGRGWGASVHLDEIKKLLSENE